MKNLVLFSFLFTITASAGFAAAQNVNSDMLDIDAIRASSKTFADEAEALAANVGKRSEDLRRAAREI